MDFLLGVVVGSLGVVVFLPVLKILYKKLLGKTEEL